jgi:AraC-like DNA-binding protein
VQSSALGVLGWIGAAQGLLLSGALLSRRDGEAADRRLGLVLGVAALAVAAITASHAGVSAALGAWLEVGEIALTFAFGPLLAAWVTAASGAPAPRWLVPALAPAALAAAAGVARLALGRGGASPALLAAAIAYQVLWTAVCCVAFARRGGAASDEGRGLVAAALAGVVLLHGAQAVRWLSPRPELRDLVPATATLLLFALSFVALRSSPWLVGRRARRAASGPPDEEARRILAELERLCRDERAHLEPELSLGSAARRLGVSTTALSRAVNRAGGARFADFLARLRVEEACRLLSDPAVGHLSVEAVGQRSGFRSRSVFYEAFRRATGKTPAEFRERRSGSAAG